MITADLTGKKVLVTGASSGIGRAAATLFARCGATVAVNHLADDTRGPAVVDALNGEGCQAVSAPGDVSDPKSADDMVAGAIDRLGGLDILLNNAGTAATVEPIPFDDLDAMTEERWLSIMHTNVIGPFRCSRAAAPALRKTKGVIVNTGLDRRPQQQWQFDRLCQFQGRRHQPDALLGPRAGAGHPGERGRARPHPHRLDRPVVRRAQADRDGEFVAPPPGGARGYRRRHAVPGGERRDNRADHRCRLRPAGLTVFNRFPRGKDDQDESV